MEDGEEGAEEDVGKIPLLVTKDVGSGAILPMVVLAKGTAHPWVAKRVAKWI